jgi:Tol biopolymer transport system component
VYVVKPDGSCPQRVTDGGEPAFSPKGDLLAVTRCDGEVCSIVVVSRDGSDVRGLVAGPFSRPSWSADGAHVYVSREEEDLSTATWVVRADGTGLRRLAPPWVEQDDPRWSIAATSEESPTVSPDGTRYAFASSDAPTVGIGGLQEAIFVRSVDGGERRQLSDPSGNTGDYEPAWSPDGRSISYQRSGELAVMSADGSNERVLTQVNGATTSAWSPDSRELVFTRELYGGGGYFSNPSALMVVDVESRDVRRLTWGPKPVATCESPR